MTYDYRDRLFRNYNKTHSSFFGSDTNAQIDWFMKYINRNYMPHLMRIDKHSAEILEIGCGKGTMMAALSALGFKRLIGVDLSPDDVKYAQDLVPHAEIIYADATDFLNDHKKEFDVIIVKAVLEHIKKEEVLSFLEKVKEGLKVDGIVLIDVPNMDWLFSPHERYMDFTHEVGFTRESLRQIMNTLYTNVGIYPAEHILSVSMREEIQKRFARFVVRKLLGWADPQGAGNLIWERSIIGVGANE